MNNTDKLLTQYKKLEDNNDHNEAALLLVKTFGTQDEVNAIERIKIMHERRGHILQEEIDKRRTISQKYYKLLHKLN